MSLYDKRRAFTLVELIIVIAVAAILAVGIFVASKPQKRMGETNDAKRKNDAQAFEQAIKMLAADSGVMPTELKELDENIPFALVKAGGLISGTYSCTALGTSIDKKDISSVLLSVLPQMPMDPDLSASSNETGYYIVRRGSSYDIEPCNTYELAATSGSKQMCGDGYCGSTESCSSCTQDCGACPPVVLAVGDSYGGGKVGYILQAGDPGYIAGQQHGLIAAASDQSTSAVMGCFGVDTGAHGFAIGTGNQNTITFMAGCPSGVAHKTCGDLDLNGYSDWYLPSYDELNKFCLNKVAIGGFDLNPSTGMYWVSSEIDWSSSYFQYFHSCQRYDDNKYSGYKIRCARSF